MSKRKKQPEFVSRLEAIRERGARHEFSLDPRLDLGQQSSGYLLTYSQDLLVIHEFRDFVPDGYAIRPLTTVTEISKFDAEDFFHRVCTTERMMGGLTPSWTLNLASMRSAIEGVHQHHRYLSIYEEFKPGEFFGSWGRVVYFGEHSLLMQRFDTRGEWEQRLVELFYEDVRQVDFDTPYINMFAKYMSDPPEPDLSEYDLEVLGS